MPVTSDMLLVRGPARALRLPPTAWTYYMCVEYGQKLQQLTISVMTYIFFLKKSRIKPESWHWAPMILQRKDSEI